MDKKCKLLSELVQGDKVYLYYIAGDCSVSELKVTAIEKITEAGYIPVYFDCYNWNTYFPENAGYFFRIDSAIYSTIGHMQNIFQMVFEKGKDICKQEIRQAIGIND